MCHFKVTPPGTSGGLADYHTPYFRIPSIGMASQMGVSELSGPGFTFLHVKLTPARISIRAPGGVNAKTLTEAALTPGASKTPGCILAAFLSMEFRNRGYGSQPPGGVTLK